MSFNYLELSVLASAKFGSKKANGHAFARPSLGIFFNGTQEIEGESDDSKVVSAINFAGDIGVGGCFQLKKYVNLSTDVHYGYGYTKMLDNDDVDTEVVAAISI